MGPGAIHRYSSEGTFRITLTITDNEGRTDQDTTVLKIVNTTPASQTEPPTEAQIEEPEPANLISISAIEPEQLTYFVNDTVYLTFTITDEQNIPYNFTATLFLPIIQRSPLLTVMSLLTIQPSGLRHTLPEFGKFGWSWNGNLRVKATARREVPFSELRSPPDMAARGF
jgi:hypothetical protein